MKEKTITLGRSGFLAMIIEGVLASIKIPGSVD